MRKPTNERNENAANARLDPLEDAALTALIALIQADTVLVWDPADRTLIAANLVGTMPWTER